MKKAILLSVLFLSFFSLKAQEDTPERQNEVKLNALFLVLGGFEGTYEYLLNEESGVGVSLFLPIDDELDGINYYISPYYRMYFGKKYATGFYLEGFGMLNSTVVENYNEFTFEYDDENVTDFALGIGIGGKWLTNRGLLGEIGLGVGRNLFNSHEDNDFVGKIGITIGYRF